MESGLEIAALGIAAVAAVWYGLAMASPSEHYTEFSILNSETGKTDLPLTIPAAMDYRLLISIKNQEHGPRRYTVRVVGDNGYIANLPAGLLEDGAIWSRLLYIPLESQTPRQHLTLQLFIADQPTPYRELHLWLEQAGRP
jgi:uncharacterized membrane protein